MQNELPKGAVWAIIAVFVIIAGVALFYAISPPVKQVDIKDIPAERLLDPDKR